ncbi:hypothetical protein [Salininema proteolyticum]|uniref:Secreted protein n=1 Tax=Salininema proteolyticum TaxID=1607685 RepID=A0ABV8TYS6_9ACTN
MRHLARAILSVGAGSAIAVSATGAAFASSSATPVADEALLGCGVVEQNYAASFTGENGSLVLRADGGGTYRSAVGGDEVELRWELEDGSLTAESATEEPEPLFRMAPVCAGGSGHPTMLMVEDAETGTTSAYWRR